MIRCLLRIAALILSTAVVFGFGNAVLAANTVRVDYGTVEAIDIYRGSDHKPMSPGTVIGGIAGGVLGNQVGSGRGRTAATIVGAIGGGMIGHEVEKKNSASRCRVTVRLESGSRLIVEDSADGGLRVGDHVRVENDRVYRM